MDRQHVIQVIQLVNMSMEVASFQESTLRVVVSLMHPKNLTWLGDGCIPGNR